MSAPPVPRPIADLDVPLSRLVADVRALVARQQAVVIEEARLRLPLLDPDRHALDLAADEAFARLACECACEPGGAA